MYGCCSRPTGSRRRFRYPAQIEDAVTAYRWAAARTRMVALAGDSSGGGLAVQVALRQPGAAALLLLSPWIDMDPAQTATSYEENAATDLFFTRPMVQVSFSSTCRRDQRPGAGGQRLPRRPVRAAAGVRAVRRRRSGRGDERLAMLTGARLDVFDGQLHTFQMAAGRAPVADEAIGRLAAWVRPKLGL